MYENAAISERVAKIRKKYRTTKPEIDLCRYKLVTEFYMNNANYTGILLRAYNLKNLFENMPTPVNEGELIVGYPASTYRGCPLFPENSLIWIKDEIDILPNREVDPYDISDETKKYIKDTWDFWFTHCTSAQIDAAMPDEWLDVAGTGALTFKERWNSENPIGHFCGNFWTVVDRGLGSVRDEARAKKKALIEKGIEGDEARNYEFYKAVEIVTDGLIHYTKRYAAECARQAAECKDPKRKSELLKMADSLNWIMENPARDYQEAVQAVWMYQLGLILDAQLHGISYGRFDQYVGKYAEADIASGKLTREEAQEITDCFMLKVAECNKLWSTRATKSGPGYTTGQLITIGGQDKDGNDATNVVTYMVLQGSARLKLHNPPVAIRIHDNTPIELWEAAIMTNSQVGGVPAFQYDGIIIESIMRRGIPLEDARNYCLIGCVEPAVCGCDFSTSGGDGNASYTILPAIFWCAINNGVNPFKMSERNAKGLETGYLYDMKSMDEVLAAYEKQVDYFTNWHTSLINVYEFIYAKERPIPLLSATMGGCMEKGLDVLWGGAKYNASGNSSIGHGTVADSFNIIDQLCFREKKCTTRELYDALMANWEGYEELHQYILGKAAHFGNDNPEADKYLKFVADTYADNLTKHSHVRGGGYIAGCWPVTLNIVLGKINHATPDGRFTGEPLSDGISPVAGLDKNGPFATINSILKFDQAKYANGTLCNMKFHPTALQGADGWKKVKAVMETYFKQGGMEMQLNIVSSETLRKAQENPQDYQDLVVRIAGFSAYFVEVFKDAQDALIARTEMNI